MRQLILQHLLFNLFAKDAQERLLGEAQQRHAPASSLLLQQGQPAERFFLVLSGRVKLFRISADGQEKVVEMIHPGQTFAEAVMFMQHAVYPVCAESLDAVELVSFPNRLMLNLLAEHPATWPRPAGPEPLACSSGTTHRYCLAPAPTGIQTNRGSACSRLKPLLRGRSGSFSYDRQ